MKGNPADSDLLPARSLDEALGLLARPGVRPLAGGTDVLVMLAAGRIEASTFVDVSRLSELRGIEVEDAAITLGALTTYSEIQAHDVVRRELPMLAAAARLTGGWAIQNRGTLGGNIANASPAADSSPPLLAYGADVEIAAPAGRRWVPYAEFHKSYRQTVIAPGELVTRIRVPRTKPGDRSSFHKVGPRLAQAISKVCFAGWARPKDGGGIAAARLAFGGVAPTAVRAYVAEDALVAGASRAEILAAVSAAVAPIDDLRSTAKFRRHVSLGLAAAFLDDLGSHGLLP